MSRSASFHQSFLQVHYSSVPPVLRAASSMHYLQGGAPFWSNLLLKKHKAIQLWVDSLWLHFGAAVWGLEPFLCVTLLAGARIPWAFCCEWSNSFLAVLKQLYVFICQDPRIKNHNPCVSHLQLLQARLVPYLGMSSAAPQPAGLPLPSLLAIRSLPLVLEHEAHVGLCLSATHCQTLVLRVRDLRHSNRQLQM